MLSALAYESWVLHALIWLPLLGMVHVLWAAEDRAKWLALRWSLVVFVLSVGLWWAYDPALGGGYQLASSRPWIAVWGVNYALGLDGISLFMVLLSTFTTPLAILGSFNYIKKRQKPFYALMLLLEVGVVGVFSAVDLFLFYVFFELTLVPMYFIIGIWGGERRIYAAIKFFLYTAVGSLLMLVGILYIYTRGKALLGVTSFAFVYLLQIPLTPEEQMWLFGAFALAFAIKVPVFPFHTWLPDAHVEAPTPGSVVLAAVLLKMGTYGFVRFLLPFFPVAAQHPSVVTLMLTLGVIGIIYAAWVAAVQPDAKKLVAYTSVAHMGFVVIGVFALNVNGLQGGLLVMISHGISTGALFLLVGMLYERRHTRADRGIRWYRARGTLAGHRVRDHRSGVHRVAGHKRVRRRVPRAPWCLRESPWHGHPRGERSHLCRVLYAADGAERLLQRVGKAGEPGGSRSVPPRGGHPGAHDRSHDRDRRASDAAAAKDGAQRPDGARARVRRRPPQRGPHPVRPGKRPWRLRRAT